MKELRQLIRIMSQAEIGRRLGLARAHITHWKRNKKIPLKHKESLLKLYKKEVLNVQKR